MICPHCSTAAKFDWSVTNVLKYTESDKYGDVLLYGTCPNCHEIVVFLSTCYLEHNNIGMFDVGISNDGDYMTKSKKMIYPKKEKFELSHLIPENYLKDYEESYKVIGISPKASAALSRRLLQHILREEYKINKKRLSDEIEEFINIQGIPSHITEAIDAVRNIGNFAAHPSKDTKTGEIVEVEPVEAEWLLEVNEALFDFCFIQPKKIENRRKVLNDKLKALGKPPMK